MKNIKHIDFAAQTCIILLTGVGLAFSHGRNLLLMLLIAQLLLGPWQMLSSLLSVTDGTAYHKLKALHLVLSGFYLIVVFGTYRIIDEKYTRLLLTLPAWVLGFYYYFINSLEVLRKPRKGGKFLPHTSF